MRRLPIRLKLTLAFAGVMAMVLAATGLLVYLRLDSELDATLDNGLRSRASDVGTLVRQGSPDGTPNSPNNGTLTTVGSLVLGTNLNEAMGFDIGSIYVDDRKIRRVLKWRPKVEIREGLCLAVNYYREHRDQ